MLNIYTFGVAGEGAVFFGELCLGCLCLIVSFFFSEKEKLELRRTPTNHRNIYIINQIVFNIPNVKIYINNKRDDCLPIKLRISAL